MKLDLFSNTIKGFTMNWVSRIIGCEFNSTERPTPHLLENNAIFMVFKSLDI